MEQMKQYLMRCAIKINHPAVQNALLLPDRMAPSLFLEKILVLLKGMEISIHEYRNPGIINNKVTGLKYFFLRLSTISPAKPDPVLQSVLSIEKRNFILCVNACKSSCRILRNIKTVYTNF